MIWIHQQSKVENLAARSDYFARHCAGLRSQMRQWMRYHVRQPETLAWAFAAGTWFGIAPARKRVSRTLTLLQWVNTIAVLSKFLAQVRGQFRTSIQNK